MQLKLKPEELNKVREIMRSDSLYLDEEINKLNEYLIELQTVWKGIDANNFYINFSGYLNKLKTVPMALNDIEFFINKANKIYCEKDRNFASAIRRDRNKYE